ncbi:hypothetical protein V6615_04540 [Oscillospiraceae bacterium PP1C4]
MEILIRMSYGVMIVAVMMCYLLAKKQQRNLRLAVNQFAFAFVKISNYVSPFPPKENLRVEQGTGESVKAMQWEQQPETLRVIMKRAGNDCVVQLYEELCTALEEVSHFCGKNKKLVGQFLVPIQELFDISRIFLLGCENLDNIRTTAEEKAFNQFLKDQLHHRKELLKRISGDASGDYADLNRRYVLTEEA